MAFERLNDSLRSCESLPSSSCVLEKTISIISPTAVYSYFARIRYNKSVPVEVVPMKGGSCGQVPLSI
jgi:hypothetical protein